jgi:hypothetical protein
MIDFTKLTDEELLQHRNDINDYIQNIKIKEPNFHLHKSIQIEHTSCVNSDTLIPNLEFKISVNKEDVEHFRHLWEEYYNKQNQFYRYHRSLPPEKQVTVDIKHEIERQFVDYLDSLFPVVHYG